MKLRILFFACVALATAFPSKNVEKIDDLNNYDDTNNFEDDDENESKIVYHLYTKMNPTEAQILSPGNTLSLAYSNFNAINPTKFIIHGWIGDETSVMTALIQPFVHQKGVDNNVIFVDWSSSAMTINYAAARKRAARIGKEIAAFIDMLHVYGGLSFKTLTVVGHSLGCHVSGYAGKNVKYGKIDTIIGLDPAMPLFRIDKPTQRLCDTDASYVETIHTNGHNLAFYHPLGNSSFYPNWGKVQPGCEKDLSGYCSHARAVYFYAEAIESDTENKFFTTKCADYESLVAKNCSIDSEGIKMLHRNNIGNAKGIYYLPTHSKSPYAVGEF